MSILTGHPCRVCREFKALSEFPKGKGQYRCKPCAAKATREYRRNRSPEKAREQEFKKNLWRRYKMRPATFYELAKNGCEVCGTMDNLCVDHDHSCCPTANTCGNCIRGVLCANHNRGEGYFKSIEEITALLAYRLKFEKDDEVN